MEGNEHLPPLNDTTENHCTAKENDKEGVDQLELDPPDEQQDTLKAPDTPFDHHNLTIGDHVYKWSSFAGIPGMFQRHAVVFDVNEEHLTIVDFNNMIRREEDPPKVSLLTWPSEKVQLREDESAKKWKKVEYSASLWKRSLWRSGTCTAVKSDPPGLVMARVQFLMDHTNTLPDYHFLKANCECVAVWCKTGTWATLQASSFLHVTAAGQAKSATTLALYASSQTVTVPSAGLWGWLGYTTKVSLLATHPWIVPALAGYGVVTVGGPVWILARTKSFWNATTTRLNSEFWESAIDKPDLFVECITEWSQVET